MRINKKCFLAVVLMVCLALVCAFAACTTDDGPDGTENDTRVYWGTLEGVVSEYAESPVKASPVEGVTVKSGDESAVTDKDGKYSIKVYSNGATVSFEKEGYITQTKTVKSSSFRSDKLEYDFLIYVSARVEGIVKDSSGKALSGVSVSVGVQQVTTDAQGKFVFEEVIGTSMMIVATHNGKTVRKPVYTEEMRTGSVTVEIILG